MKRIVLAKGKLKTQKSTQIKAVSTLRSCYRNLCLLTSFYLCRVVLQVEGIQTFADALKNQYAGEKLMEIIQTEDQVVEEWKALLSKVHERASKLGQSDEYQKLIIMIQNLLLWIQDMRSQIESDESPKYVLIVCISCLPK